MERDLSYLLNRPIAHRGLHNQDKEIFENTLSSFKSALDNDYLIELDVHLTKDNKVVVIHDDNLKRLFNIDKKIKNLTLEELKNYKFPHTEDTIPAFSEVLDLVKGKVPIIIELKYDARVGKLEKEVITLLQNYSGLVAVKSFRAKSIRYFKKHAPEVIRGQLLSDNRNIFYTLFFYLRIFYGKFSKPDFYSCHLKIIKHPKICQLRENHLILGWTIKNKNDIKYAKEYCDNYIFEEENVGGKKC